MTLLIIKMPPAINAITVAKNRFEDSLQFKRVPLHEYITYEEALLVYPKKDLFHKLTNTSTFNGFKLKDTPEIYIYPHEFYFWLQKYYKRKLSKIIFTKDDIPYQH